MMTVKEIETKCEEMFRRAGLRYNAVDTPVVINNRLKTTLGRCCYKIVSDVTVPVRLEFSKQLLETTVQADIDKVIAHECAHAIAALETGISQGHNTYFKAICAKIGYAEVGSSKTKVEKTVEDEQLYKYFVTCKCCGKIVGKYYRAGKVVQHPDWYSCKCGGKLSVTQNF